MATFWWFGTLSAVQAGEPGKLSAGAAKVDISPAADAALPMSGYAGRTAGFKGIHDHIYARAIVLSDGEKTAAVVSWELIGVPTPVWEELSQRVARLGLAAVGPEQRCDLVADR